MTRPTVTPTINAFHLPELLQLARLVFVFIHWWPRLYLGSKSSRWKAGSVLRATSE